MFLCHNFVHINFDFTSLPPRQTSPLQIFFLLGRLEAQSDTEWGVSTFCATSLPSKAAASFASSVVELSAECSLSTTNSAVIDVCSAIHLRLS